MTNHTTTTAPFEKAARFTKATEDYRWAQGNLGRKAQVEAFDEVLAASRELTPTTEQIHESNLRPEDIVIRIIEGGDVTTFSTGFVSARGYAEAVAEGRGLDRYFEVVR